MNINQKKKPVFVEKNMKIYEKRRDVLVKGLNDIGWKTEKSQATFYIWTQILEGEKSCMDFVKNLIDFGVVITPGIGFGQYGEGFVRFALTQPIDRIKEAIERISQAINK